MSYIVCRTSICTIISLTASRTNHFKHCFKTAIASVLAHECSAHSPGVLLFGVFLFGVITYHITRFNYACTSARSLHSPHHNSCSAFAQANVLAADNVTPDGRVRQPGPQRSHKRSEPSVARMAYQRVHHLELRIDAMITVTLYHLRHERAGPASLCSMWGNDDPHKALVRFNYLDRVC